MDRSTHVTLGGILTGLVFGFPAGVLFAAVRAAWGDHKSARDKAVAAGRMKWRLSGQGLLLAFLLAVGVALALGGIAERIR
jgi:ABC-type antimicrobial peptide transport system permease subunit